jgi:HlyD family secretion protein
MRASIRLRRLGTMAIVVVVGSLAIVAYRSQAAAPAPAPILGVVHRTEIRIAPDTSARLASFRVTAGQEVHKGDVLALLSSPELAAAVQEAEADSAVAKADRTNVYAGVRSEEVAIAAQNVTIAESNLVLAQQQYTRAATLAYRDFTSKQHLDESTATLSKAKASLDLARASYVESKRGPTKEEREIAEAKVTLADATIADLEASLAKTILAAPVDGVVGLLIARPGEAISAGQPVMTLEAGHERWFTFTIRENLLEGITIGVPLTLRNAAGEQIQTRVTELRPLGEFAVWRAARAVGDHDTNSFLVRADPVGEVHGLEPGMSVWLDRGTAGR